jgi:glycosyltransferase involved in cell wall biosynthesis
LETDRLSCPRLSDLPRLLLCSFDVIPGPSGSARRLTEYLKALPDRFTVVVLSAKTPDHSHIEKYQGARLLRVPVGSGDLVSRIQAFERAVRRQLESEEYALAHFTDPFGGYVLCEQKGDYGYRLIYEAQTFPSQDLRYTHPQTEGDKRFLAKVRRQELFCLMNADLVVTGSQTTRDYIQSLGASTEQIRLIRSPVDLEPYTPEVLGEPDGQPMRLMYLGSQAGWQGLPTLLRALALAIEQGVEVKLTLVGPRNPDWQPHLEDLSRELGIQEHVEFQPPVLHDDLAKVLALGDVGVLPLEDVDRNRLQGGPLAKVSEYFAAGRPVIAADLPVTREMIPDATALFHPPGDSRALANRIIELAQDVPQRLELGRQARAFAEKELDAGRIRGQVLDLYDELLGHQTPVGPPSEMPIPTMTGTPTNRIPQTAPPERRRSSRGSKSPSASSSEPGKPPAPATGKKQPPGEELPLVVGQALEERLDTRLIKTDPDARPPDPPVVMGQPLRERAAASTSSTPREEPPAPTPIIKAPAPSQRRHEPEEPPTSRARAPTVPGSEERSELTTDPVRLPAGVWREEAAASPPAPSPTSRASMEVTGEAPEPPARAPARLPTEEPPEPTPIIPAKAIVAAHSSRTSRQESSTPTSVRSPTQEPVRAQEGPLVSARSSPQESARPQEPSKSSKTPPPLTPEDRPPPGAAAEPPSAGASEEEPEEISEEEAQEISEEAELEAAPTPPHPRPRLEEPEEISSDEVEEASEAEAVEAEADPIDEDDAVQEAEADPIDEADAVQEAEDAPIPAPPDSALDPWFAQLAHGYCPPEGAQFARHTPPTTFPGRDEEPTDPSRVPPPPRAQGASGGKSS